MPTSEEGPGGETSDSAPTAVPAPASSDATPAEHSRSGGSSDEQELCRAEARSSAATQRRASEDQTNDLNEQEDTNADHEAGDAATQLPIGHNHGHESHGVAEDHEDEGGSAGDADQPPASDTRSGNRVRVIAFAENCEDDLDDFIDDDDEVDGRGFVPIEPAPSRQARTPFRCQINSPQFDEFILPSSVRFSNSFPARYRPITSRGYHSAGLRARSQLLTAGHSGSRHTPAGNAPSIPSHTHGHILYDLSAVLPSRSPVMALHDCIESRPPMARDLDGPGPWSYSPPRTGPPHQRQAPAFTIGTRPKETSGGGRTAHGKPWMKSNDTWTSPVTFERKWPAPNTYRPPTGFPNRRKRPSEAGQQATRHGPAQVAAIAARHGQGQDQVDGATRQEIGLNAEPRFVKSRFSVPSPTAYTPWYGSTQARAPVASIFGRQRTGPLHWTKYGSAPAPNNYAPQVHRVYPSAPSFTIGQSRLERGGRVPTL
eukprot:scpid49002/ scgid17054/ 